MGRWANNNRQLGSSLDVDGRGAHAIAMMQWLQSAGAQYRNDPPETDEARNRIAEKSESREAEEERSPGDLHGDGRTDDKGGDDQAGREAIDGLVQLFDELVEPSVFQVDLELVAVQPVEDFLEVP